MKGRNFSTLYGKFNIGEPVTVYARKGILQANRLAKVIHMPVTKRAVEIREALTVIAYGANQLDKKGRTEWGVKGGEYCAYLKGRHLTAKFPHYMKPHEKLPSDWQKYYLFSNLIAASSGFSWPRQKAPLTGGPP